MMTTMKLSKTSILIAIMLLVGATQAHAATWRVDFSGSLDTIDAALLGTDFTIGDTFSGVYFFDDTTPDTHPAGDSGDYLSFGRYIASTSGGIAAEGSSVRLLVTNDIPYDSYVAAAAWVHGTNSASGIPFNGVAVQLEDSTGTALSSASLPTSIDLSAYTSARFIISFEDWDVVADPWGDDAVFAKASGALDTMTFTPVPEPATMTLLALGGLAVLRKRRKQ
jgi:hypothetical protein